MKAIEIERHNNLVRAELRITRLLCFKVYRRPLNQNVILPRAVIKRQHWEV
jgi:hypothetical protein